MKSSHSESDSEGAELPQMLYVFRVESTKFDERLPEEGRAFLWQELQQGRLRQGWGIPGMSLVDARHEAIARDRWVQNFRQAAEHAGWEPRARTVRAAARRHTLLSHMREIRRGALLLVPNLAQTGRRGLVLVRAISKNETLSSNCYGWDGATRRRRHPLGDDRRHLVRVDPFTIRAVSYEGTVAAKIRTLLGPLRNCIVPVNSTQNKALVGSVTRLYGGSLSGSSSAHHSAKNRGTPRKGHPPTAGQLERGVKGEEEVLRRLKSSKGIFGLNYREDRRNSGDGFDFLCTDGAREIEVEVKTFSATDGQIIISENELCRAALSKERYCLLGVFDSGRRPPDWKVRALWSPSAELYRVGDEQIVRQFRVSPNDIKWHS